MDFIAEQSPWLLILLPLAGAGVSGIFGRRLSQRWIAWLSCSTVGASFLIALWLFLEFLQWPAEERVVTHHLFTWIESGSFSAQFSLLFDPLSLVMILIVTGVGFLIHVYSAGYMAGDTGFYRYFAYLNLFIFMMTVLVLADNYVLMFVGWEGVGLCSYLLIGYYFDKKSAGDAAQKAFIVNRIGDVGFVLGVLLIFKTFESVEYVAIFEKTARQFPVPETQFGLLGAITLLLFIGATGKSAQIPLYVWLPDAMEGPTPVSALIHAATMVTAGVYMIARSAPLYSRAPETLLIVAIVGTATALWAAVIAVAQRDIKKVLAYSTISQLGYMFLAVGVGAFAGGIFHLMTHAFFKALLFLGSGSIMLALHHEPDLFRMGGLGRHLKVTFYTMWVGTFALAGVPLLSGFFSKDEILWKAFSSPYGHWVFWALGMAVAGLTAFYMFRLMFLAFHGKTCDHAREDRPQEPGRVVTVPLMILAFFSALAGYIGLPGYLGENHFERFLEPSFSYLPPHTAQVQDGHGLEIVLTVAAIVVAALGMWMAYYCYLRNRTAPERMASRFNRLYTVIREKFFVDEVYDVLIVRPIELLSRNLLWKAMDVGIIDRFVDGTASMMQGWGHLLKRIQSGYARSYAGWILWGALLILAYYYVVMASS